MLIFPLINNIKDFLKLEAPTTKRKIIPPINKAAWKNDAQINPKIVIKNYFIL